jgi:hypothetical protein
MANPPERAKRRILSDGVSERPFLGLVFAMLRSFGVLKERRRRSKSALLGCFNPVRLSDTIPPSLPDADAACVSAKIFHNSLARSLSSYNLILASGIHKYIMSAPLHRQQPEQSTF